MPDKVTFSWRNYYKPNPPNLERMAASMRRILALVSGSTLIAGADPMIAFWIIVGGGVLDEAKNFFAWVSMEYNEKVSINIPPAVADKVEITENEVKDENK